MGRKMEAGRDGRTYAVVMGGDGISDENAMLVTEGYGPVVTSPRGGAETHQ